MISFIHVQGERATRATDPGAILKDRIDVVRPTEEHGPQGKSSRTKIIIAIIAAKGLDRTAMLESRTRGENPWLAILASSVLCSDAAGKNEIGLHETPDLPPSASISTRQATRNRVAGWPRLHLRHRLSSHDVPLRPVQDRARGQAQKKTSLKIFPAIIRAPVTAVGAEMVGNYAIRIDWSDQHGSGIYSFQYLRDICQILTIRIAVFAPSALAIAVKARDQAAASHCSPASRVPGRELEQFFSE